MAGNEETPLHNHHRNMVSSSSSSPSTTPSFLARCFPWFNLTAISALTVAVVFLFLQLQIITFSVAKEQSQIQKILDQLSSQQAQTQDLTVQVHEEHDLTILHMAGSFTLLSGLITMFHMSAHLRNFHEPFVQRKILAILWMSPIYGITSFLSLVWPVLEGYLSILKDFYEAYVIYQFLSFLIAVLGRGDRSVVVRVLARHADHLKPPSKCWNRCFHPPPDSTESDDDEAMAHAVLLECQLRTMQFVFCRPLTSIAAFVVSTLQLVEQQEAHKQGQVEEEPSRWAYFVSPLFFIAMVQNVSVFVAFSGMLKFYHAVRDDLLWCQPFPKFLAIKGVVFMTFWQGLVISIFVNLKTGGRWEDENDPHTSPREKAAMVQNVLICLEMLFFSIAHWCVFPTEEWEEGYRPREYAKPGMGFKDFVEDISYIAESRKLSRDSRRKRKGGLDNHHQSNNGDHDSLALEEEEAAQEDALDPQELA